MIMVRKPDEVTEETHYVISTLSNMTTKIHSGKTVKTGQVQIH